MTNRVLTFLVSLVLATGFSGCSGVNPVRDVSLDTHLPEIDLSRAAPPWILRVDHLVAGAVLYYAWQLKDESVWDAEVKPAGRSRYRITMKKDRLLDRGDGEAPVIFKLTAEQVAVKNKCESTRTLEYTERLASQVIGTQRIAEGLIECVKVAAK